MITKLRKRIESEKGFTLIEMLIVIIILGILIAIAVPAYLKFRDNANESAAKSNIRAAIPAMEAYHADNGKYDGMSTKADGTGTLQVTYDKALKGPPAFNVKTAVNSTYCVEATSGNKTAHKKNDSDIVLGSLCP